MPDPREKFRLGDWWLDHFGVIFGVMMVVGMVVIALKNGVGSVCD